MSTYWYLECMDHDPPLRSDREVSQHTDEHLDWVVDNWARLAAWNDEPEPELYDVWGLPGEFRHAAAVFGEQHPRCRVQFRSEYGDTRPLAGTSTNETSSELVDALAELAAARRTLDEIRAVCVHAMRRAATTTWPGVELLAASKAKVSAFELITNYIDAATPREEA